MCQLHFNEAPMTFCIVLMTFFSYADDFFDTNDALLSVEYLLFNIATKAEDYFSTIE